MPKKSLGALFPNFPEDLSEVLISDATCDSRLVKPGSIFFAVPGVKQKGEDFIPDALARGASVIVAPADSAPAVSAGVPVVRVSDVRREYSRACAELFENPSGELLSIGVTGTNGKTSVSWIIGHALDALGKKTSLCGTLGLKIPLGSRGEFEPLANTTPDPKLVHSFLSESVAAGCGATVLEVTSQGVVQSRTADVHWDAAIFTNLTRDHLDLHGTMEEYASAKTRFFTDELGTSTKSERIAVTNLDDGLGARLYEILKTGAPSIRTLGYSLGGKADAAALEPRWSMDSTEFLLKTSGGDILIRSHLVGAFNVANLLAAAATLHGLGFSLSDIRDALASVPPVPGRLEVINAPVFHAVVDYSHTPDGLIQAQRSLRPLTRGRLITVFGCGGDRDRGKRPLMAQAVAELSDFGVLTSDNPRTEDPERIIADMIPGLSSGSPQPGFRHVAEADRRKAISLALGEAREGDVVLIAGKGHEDYQEIEGVRYPFSDQQICREILG